MSWTKYLVCSSYICMKWILPFFLQIITCNCSSSVGPWICSFTNFKTLRVTTKNSKNLLPRGVSPHHPTSTIVFLTFSFLYTDFFSCQCLMSSLPPFLMSVHCNSRSRLLRVELCSCPNFWYLQMWPYLETGFCKCNQVKMRSFWI